MPEDFVPNHDSHDSNLGAALRCLPLLTPERSAWPALAAELAARKRRARLRRGAALLAVAALLVLALLPLMKSAPVAPAPAPNLAATPAAIDIDEAAIARLIQANHGAEARRRLQRGLSTELDGNVALASAEIEDMVGLIDLQLQSNPDTTESDKRLSAALWQRRLDLVNTLTRVETQGTLAAPMLAQEGASGFEIN